MQLLEGTLNARADDRYAAAERHYLRGETMEAIAHDLGLSRSSVSRLLRQAREEGMVRIYLEPRGTSSPLAARIAEQFGIEVFLVAVPDSAPPALRFEAVGKRTAQLLTSLMADDMRVGVAWGVTIAQVVRQLETRPLSGVTVVQMNGSGNAADSAVPYVGAILAAVADAYGGQVIPFPIPAFFDHAEARAALWRESMIQHVLNEQAHLDLAIFGVGSLYGSVPSRVYSTGYLASDTLAMLEREVIKPQAISVVDSLATPLVTEMSAITNDAADAIPDVAADGSNALAAIIKAGQVLNQRKVPREGRVLAVGSAVEAILLNVPQLQKANEAGDGGNMLRRATIGNLFGFTIVADYALPADFAIAYHRDAFAFVTRPSRVPEGAAYGHVIAQDGFALRHIMHYNPNQLEDQSIVDTFYGAATLDANRAVSFTVADGA